ncbi:MAG: hypothetical protein ACJ8R9_05615 [Steroidobacteraceae bacterium]
MELKKPNDLEPSNEQAMQSTERRAAALLREASIAARKQPTVAKAIQCAWGWLHREGPEIMGVAFSGWCAAEDFSGWPGYLGGVLRHRYTTIAEISTSLEAAGALLSGTVNVPPGATE